jgi:hypothetical protein
MLNVECRVYCVLDKVANIRLFGHLTSANQLRFAMCVVRSIDADNLPLEVADCNHVTLQKSGTRHERYISDFLPAHYAG